MGYDELDRILKLYVKGKSVEEISNEGFDKKKVKNILQRIDANKHKLEMPTTLKVF